MPNDLVEFSEDEFDDESSDLVGSEEDVEKEQKRERERNLLLAKLASGNMRHLVTRVAFILNQFPDTRNSDVTLQIRYWETFQKDIYKNMTIDVKQLY